ncbi:hypothetical protein HY491_02340 [Candidatus Woesearchaeota archaeon]|nr:hypothetical protein [Candidatus Woesearchaeota archaeon]
MILILLCVASILFGVGLVMRDEYVARKKLKQRRRAKAGEFATTEESAAGAGFFIAGLIFLFILGVIVPWVSWEWYLDHRAFYDATREQYASAIGMYQDRAVLEIRPSTITFNELRYEGYQHNIARLIDELRERVVAYNEGIVKKRRRDANPFFSWMIIAPDDDMKLIELRIQGEVNPQAGNRAE